MGQIVGLLAPFVNLNRFFFDHLNQIEFWWKYKAPFPAKQLYESLPWIAVILRSFLAFPFAPRSDADINDLRGFFLSHFRCQAHCQHIQRS